MSFTLQIILLSRLSMPNFCQLFDRSPNISRTQHISSYAMRCNRFIPLKDNRITGNFEVTILNTGELVHSKKRGKGKAQSSEERAHIAERIEDTLSSMV